MIAVALMLAVASATPSVADAERAFAAMAGRDGQWTAFRATAADDAVMFVPAMTNAQAWLKGRADPKLPYVWGPGRTVTACDGTLAVSSGGSVRPGGTSFGVFTTVWKSTPDGWRWVLDQGHDTPSQVVNPAAPIETRASCRNARRAATAATDPGRLAPDLVVQRDKALPSGDRTALPPAADWPVLNGGRSRDGTLRWEVRGNDGTHMLAIHRWTGRRFELARLELSAP